MNKIRLALFASLVGFATLAVAADGQTPNGAAFFAFGVGGFALTLLVPLGVALFRKLNARSAPTMEELAAFREARLRAHSASNALQEELDRSGGASRS